MGVIRVEHNSNFTVMSNEHLRDQRLSLRAIGLMSKMLSNSDTYTYSIRTLEQSCKEGRDAISSALKELEACGYLEREQQRKSGSFAACDYILHELPVAVEHNSPCTENPSTVEPCTDFPCTVSPSTVNPPQRNTNTRNTNIPPIVPQGGQSERDEKRAENRKRHGKPKTEPTWKPERFAGLWNFYPRGEKRMSAVTAWEKAHLSDDEIDQLGRMLRRQMKSEEWQRGIGIPYLATYLNQRRWEEEIKPPLQAADPSLPNMEGYELWT